MQFGPAARGGGITVGHGSIHLTWRASLSIAEGFAVQVLTHRSFKVVTEGHSQR